MKIVSITPQLGPKFCRKHLRLFDQLQHKCCQLLLRLRHRIPEKLYTHTAFQNEIEFL